MGCGAARRGGAGGKGEEEEEDGWKAASTTKYLVPPVTQYFLSFGPEVMSDGLNIHRRRAELVSRAFFQFFVAAPLGVSG